MMMNQGSTYERLKWTSVLLGRGVVREEKEEKKFYILVLQLDLLTQDP